MEAFLNVISNMVLLGSLGYMIKRWMDDIKSKISDYCATNREDHKDIYAKVNDHDHRITVIETKIEID